MPGFRLVLALPLVSFALCAAQEYKFDFGPGKTETGYTQVLATSKYSIAAGFGFDSTSGITCVDRGGADALRGDNCTGTKEMFFSVKVPQGNYDVTFILGDASETSETTIKAENRRFLFDRATTAKGEFLSKTITVNRREAKSSDGSVTMSLKARELTYFTWDEKLTFRFAGAKPAICGLTLTKVDNAITVFLCGNSTVVDQLDETRVGWCGWGQDICKFFKPGVSVANYAESGLTSGGFLAMKRLTKILAEAKPGDYVFVEFGHNDQKNPADVKAYPANLKAFRDQILAKQAIPVFVAPTARDGDNDPKTSIGGLAEVMRTTAKDLNVTLIDLNAMVLTFVKALGANHKLAYMDGSHFTEYGAFELARCMAKDLKEKNNSLTPFLNEDLPVFDPSKPDPLNYLTTKGTVSIHDPHNGHITVNKGRAAYENSETGVLGFGPEGDKAHAADGRLLPEKAVPPAKAE